MFEVGDGDELAVDDIGAGHPIVLIHGIPGGPVSALLLEQCASRWTHLAVFASNAFPDTPIPFPLSLTVKPVIGGLARAAIFSRLSLAMMLKQGVGPGGPNLNAVDYFGDRQQIRSIATIFGYALRHVKELYTPIERSLSRNKLPALVGWGDRDPFFSVAQGQRTAQCIRGEFVLFDGAGHFLPAERPVQVAAHIRRLVSQNGSGAE